MSQHDSNIANASGGGTRADINSALGATATRNSGNSAPATTFAHQHWVDTTAGVLKRRNAANSGWLVERTIDEAFVVARSSNTLLDVSDIGKTVVATSSFTQTFDAAATLGDGWNVGYRNDGAGDIIFDPNGSETIDGVTTLVLSPGEACRIWCNGTTFKTVGLNRLGGFAIQATTSGTDKDFSIPPWARRITVVLNGVSLSAASDNPILRLGDAGGIESSGYVGAYQAGLATSALNNQFIIGGGGPTGSTYHGIVTLRLQDPSSNTWVCQGIVADSRAANENVLRIGGSKSLSQELTTVRVTTVTGNAWDAGAITVFWE